MSAHDLSPSTKFFWELEKAETLACSPYLKAIDNAISDEEVENLQTSFVACVLAETNASSRACLPPVSMLAKQYRSGQISVAKLFLSANEIEQIGKCIAEDETTARAWRQLGKSFKLAQENKDIFETFVEMVRKPERDMSLLSKETAASVAEKMESVMQQECLPHYETALTCMRKASLSGKSESKAAELCFRENSLMKFCQVSTLCRDQMRECIIEAKYDEDTFGASDEALFYLCQKDDVAVGNCLSKIFGRRPPRPKLRHKAPESQPHNT